MKQLELPFTKRGRRDFRRIHNKNRRAFECRHKTLGMPEIIYACDSSQARSQYLLWLRAKRPEDRPIARFVDIKAARSPNNDGKEGSAKRISKRKSKKQASA